MRHRRWAQLLRRALLALAFVALPAVGFAPAAFAASCTHVSIGGGATGLTLSPSSVTIVAGGCVTYSNDTTPLSVQVTVGSISGSATPGNTVTFRESTPGSFTVKAAQQPIGGSGSGKLIVKPAVAPRPSPTQTPTRHPPRSPSPQPSAGQSTGPQVAPTPTATPTLHPSPGVSVIGPGLGPPPIVQGIPSPSPTPSVSPPIVVGQLQAKSTRAVGLPAAVAALLLVGGGAAVGRVLLAEPSPGEAGQRRH